MEPYVGLDVSLKETSICVADGSGRIVSEGTVISEPAAIECSGPTSSRGRRRAAHPGAAVVQEWCQSGASSKPGVTGCGNASASRRPRSPVARKLAVMLHRMWRDGTDVIWSRKGASA